MNASELRAMTDADLDAAIESRRQEMFNLRFQQATGRLANTSRLRQVRRDLARCITVRRERELWAAYEAAMGEEA